jgi:hypothetical protein
MPIAAIGEPSKTVRQESHSVIGDPRRMARSQLRPLGVSQVVHLRTGVRDGQVASATHAADGRAMAIVEDSDLAVELVSKQGLVFVTVHQARDRSGVGSQWHQPSAARTLSQTYAKSDSLRSGWIGRARMRSARSSDTGKRAPS